MKWSYLPWFAGVVGNALTRVNMQVQMHEVLAGRQIIAFREVCRDVWLKTLLILIQASMWGNMPGEILEANLVGAYDVFRGIRFASILQHGLKASRHSMSMSIIDVKTMTRETVRVAV